MSAWDFERAGEVVRVDPRARIVVGAGASRASIDLAIAGHGLLYLFRNWLDGDLQRGALTAVLPDWWAQFEGPRLYFSSRFMPTPLRAFVDFVAKARPPGERA